MLLYVIQQQRPFWHRIHAIYQDEMLARKRFQKIIFEQCGVTIDIEDEYFRDDSAGMYFIETMTLSTE
jgi:hypothetical protein